MRLRARAFISAALVFGVPATAFGDDDHGRGPRLKADPFVFVGKAGDCGAGYPAGSNIVTAAWLGGMGLPDNGGPNSNPANPADNPNKRDPHRGLLLSKNGPTEDCSEAGAEIKGVKGTVVDANFTVGFDYRNGGHCGAGAPRFDIDTDAGFFFVGCANAPQTPAPQDPAQWTRTRSVVTACGSECFPSSIPVGAKIRSISVTFDEGTTTANNDTQGVGLAVLDNIFISGRIISSGKGVEPKGGEQGRDDDD